MRTILKESYRGHKYGDCWVSPTKELVYINIPKNASSSMKQEIEDWTQYNYHQSQEILTNSKQIIVILRNPVTRWVSGIIQYLYGELSYETISNEVSDIIFSKIEFDDHTAPQTDFLVGIDDYLSKCIFFYCDEKLVSNINHLLNVDLYHMYNHLNEPKRIKLANEINILLKNNKYRHKIKEYYKQDYAMIKSVGLVPTR